MKTKGGFTLIELLAVIAVIAVLAAVLIPTVQGATGKARGAADAANLRSLLGQANTLLLNGKPEEAAGDIGRINVPACATFPGAAAYIGYQEPGFLKPFYKVGDTYYDLEYFIRIAQTGKQSGSPNSGTEGLTMYPIGG